MSIFQSVHMADMVLEQIAALKDEDWGVREDAAIALADLRDPRSIRPLIEALHDSDRAVREAASSALGAIGEPAVQELGTCLQSQNLLVQEAAASLLASLADERVLDPLITALLSPDWIVRMYAAQALRRVSNPQGIDTLILLLQDNVKAVRGEAIATLKAIGERAVPSLVESLEHPEWRVRLVATEALGILKSSSSTKFLIKRLLQDPDTAVRQDAARALGEIGDTQAVEALLSAVQAPLLRSTAIEALGKIRDRRAVPTLLRVLAELNTADYEDRLSSCVDDRYKQDLTPIEAAVRALAKIGDPDTLPILMASLQSTLLRKEAAEALSAFGSLAIPHLLATLKTEKDDNIRFHVKEALTRVGWKPGQIRL